MNATEEFGRLLTRLVPGGAHTYSKGDDQWPANAPKCIERGKGCRVWDADGVEYVDWSMGLTSIAFGHAHEDINRAAIEAMSLGHNFQRPSVMEAKAAKRFLDFLGDRGEMVKFAKNGSTVTTAAVKLSRAFTMRDKVAVCAEHPFFSYDDWFIGSTRCPDGVPEKLRALTVKFSFNDLASVRAMFAAHPGQIACVIVEPVKFEPPRDGFLSRLKEECEKNGALLVLDEMVSGFNWHHQGAGKYYGAEADLYTWGKGLANGHSVCALTGRRDVMELGGILHDKPRVFLSSTTHGAEIPQLAALMKVLDILDGDPDFFERNWRKGEKLRADLLKLLDNYGLADAIDLIGAPHFMAMVVKRSGHHAPNVARTFLLQELVARGQLFQGLFYVTAAHDESALKETLDAWNGALAVFRRFLEEGLREELVGEPTKPVFRAFNSCECLSESDCSACLERMRRG
jgi:glutamate-1-semialdehyde 2,1-aminomutase